MMTVQQPDSGVREGYRMVEIIGLPSEEGLIVCRNCGYANDPSLYDCHACGAALDDRS